MGGGVFSTKHTFYWAQLTKYRGEDVFQQMDPFFKTKNIFDDTTYLLTYNLASEKKSFSILSC
jgi:hypothetical protein